MKYHYYTPRMAKIKQKDEAPNADNDVERLDQSYSANENVK